MPNVDEESVSGKRYHTFDISRRPIFAAGTPVQQYL